MSTRQLTTEELALPLSERVSPAPALWQGIDAGLTDTDERDAGRDNTAISSAARRAMGLKVAC